MVNQGAITMNGLGATDGVRRGHAALLQRAALAGDVGEVGRALGGGD